jgi:transcriptional regulator with XRE-family HTH domain
MTKRLIAVGEKLRVARREQGFSLRELASRADVSASLLSQIESGKVTPSAASLFQIATALELPVHAFFPTVQANKVSGEGVLEQLDQSEMPANQVIEQVQVQTGEKPSYAEMEGRSLISSTADQLSTTITSRPVVDANARMVIELLGGTTWARLTPGTEEGMEFLEIRYPAGYSSGPQMLHHAGREFGFVIEGELTMEVAFERYLLKTGDSIVFDSTTPHRCNNNSTSTTRALWVRFTPHQRPKPSNNS